MATTAGPGPAGTTQSTPGGWSKHAAIVAAGLGVVIVAVLLIAHAVHGNPTTPTAAGMSSSGKGAMKMTATPTATPGMTASSAAMSPNAVMTVRGANLPMMQTSGAAPMAMAMVPLGHADWDGMEIQARTSAPATFELFNGTSQTLVKPTAKDSFHLMVTLSDAQTGYAIPYSSVWATVRKSGKIVFDERLWPMISRYMGPHYGNNVQLPAGGLYHLTLLVSPPVAARHLEYKGLWLTPHRVNMAFRWVPKT
jgi:Fe2+ transport protein